MSFEPIEEPFEDRFISGLSKFLVVLIWWVLMYIAYNSGVRIWWELPYVAPWQFLVGILVLRHALGTN